MKTAIYTHTTAILALFTLGACPPAEADTDTGTTEPASSSSTDAGVTTGAAEVCPAPKSGPTIHEDTIAMNEVWTADGSPHIVTPWVRIPDGATLTIEPCAELRMQKDAALVFGHPGATMASKLVAEGEPDRPIRIVRDGAEPWSALVAYHPATLSLAHTTLEGGGSDSFLENASLVLRGDGETPTKQLALVDHVTIRDSVGHGLMTEWTAGFLPGSTQLVVTGSGDEKHIIIIY